MAQVVTRCYKVPFITFNASPMMGTIQKKFNIFTPEKALRSISASFKKGVEGHNYRLVGDLVSSRFTSSLGHYGKAHDLCSRGGI